MYFPIIQLSTTPVAEDEYIQQDWLFDDDTVNDNSDYAQEFLTRNLPEQFDADMLAGVEMQELGANLLRRMKGQVTAYGAIARCDDLYALPVMEPELDETPQMGGMA